MASIASYAGYRGQYLAEQIRKDHWQNAWNDMRRSERLYGLFPETNKEQQETPSRFLSMQIPQRRRI